MKATGLVGRAELARLLCEQGEAAAAAAHLLGFEAPEPAPSEGEAPSEPAQADPPGAAAPPPEPTPADDRPPLWWVTQVEHRGPPEPPPERPKHAPVKLGGSLVVDRDPEPATPWPQIWPRLHALISVWLERRAVDPEPLTRAMAQARPLQRLPRLRSRRWPTTIEVWVDRSDRTLPMQADQHAVLDGLRRLVSRRLKVRYLPPGTPLGPLVEAGDGPVLVLGDLGHFGDAMDQHSWRAVGRRLRARGRLALALVPTDAAIDAGPWQVAPWGTRGAADACPERLLDLASPAELVQPGLLRAIRRRLTHKGLTAELAAWNHPDVAVRMSVGLLLRPEKRPARRARAAAQPAAHGALSALIRDWHQTLLGEARLRQALAWDGLGFHGQAPADLTAARRWVLGVAAQVDSGVDEAEWRPFARRLFEWLPPAALRDPQIGAALSELWAFAHAGDEDVEVPAELDPRYLAERDRSLRRVRLYQRGAHLVTDGPGVALADMDATAPTWWVDRVQQPVDAPIDLAERAALTLETDRTTVRLARQPWPAWAAALGWSDGAGWADVALPGGQDRLYWYPAAQAWRSEQRPGVGVDEFGVFEQVTIADVPVRFRLIPAGEFLMGSPDDDEEAYPNEKPQRRVRLTEPFWLAETPTTQALWQAVMDVRPLDGVVGRSGSALEAERTNRYVARLVEDWTERNAEHPQEGVSWKDIQRFLQRANRVHPDLELRLPSEAQWEYACRAGTTAARYDSELRDIAWFDQNTRGSRQVATKAPNSWGLYDTLGNVREWCADYWQDSYEGAEVADPKGPVKGGKRVYRGGSWFDHSGVVRAAYRGRYAHGNSAFLGFRLARGYEAGQGEPPAEPQVALSAEEIRGIVELALQYMVGRTVLLAFLPPEIVAMLPHQSNLMAQFISDLSTLCGISESIHGEVPARIWLKNLAFAVKPWPKASNSVNALLARIG